MSGYVNPLDFEELYNAIELAGARSPGRVTLSGHDRKIEWDVKKGTGLSGATTTPKAVPPIEFTATFYLVRDDAQGIDQLAEWPSFLAIVESTVNGSKAKAVDIYHPDLASQTPPITSVCKASVGGVTHDGKGGQTVVVKFQEYRAPKPAPKTPTAAKSSFVGPLQDPDAAAKAEIARLTAQYQKTPWG
jgi:hypothetical protein